MTSPSDGSMPDILTDRPTPARMYDYNLGGKDNFAVDRAAALAGLEHFPDILDAARDNRLFLYRLVRYLARDAGVTQFLDLGSGLPTQNNVHQVAQQFQPDARVVYVDVDPIVLAHGQALLATDDSTTFISADMTKPEPILEHPETLRLLDFSQPVAVLLLSVGHSIVSDDDIRHMLSVIFDQIVSGSYLAFTQLVTHSQEIADVSNEFAKSINLPWKTRLTPDIDGFLNGMEPVEPGLLDITKWRPDPDQPPLAPVDEPLRPYLGAAQGGARFFEYGGLLRKP